EIPDSSVDSLLVHCLELPMVLDGHAQSEGEPFPKRPPCRMTGVHVTHQDLARNAELPEHGAGACFVPRFDDKDCAQVDAFIRREAPEMVPAASGAAIALGVQCDAGNICQVDLVHAVPMFPVDGGVTRQAPRIRIADTQGQTSWKARAMM